MVETTKSTEGEAKVYNKLKFHISFIDTILNLSLLAIFAFTPISRYLNSYIQFYFEGTYIKFFIFITTIASAFFLISLPLNFYSGFIIEHQFGLSNQSIKQWILDNIKSIILSTVIGVPLSLAFYYVLQAMGSDWWLYFSIIIFSFSFLLAQIAPILIFPLFYKFTLLKESEVKTKIEKLLKKQRIKIKGIYIFNMSKNTNKANAGFTGFGRTKRIILSDTLLSNFSIDEIEVIFAHELAHYTRKHILKNIFISGVIIFSSFYICNYFYIKTIKVLGYLNLFDLPALPILFLYLSTISLLITPLLNIISRKFEREADYNALDYTKNRKAFISSMEKLAKTNFADKSPHPLVEFFTYSHPSLRKRILFAKNTEIRD